MLKREITAIVGIALLGVILFWAPPMAYTLLVGVVIFMAAWEAQKMLYQWKPHPLGWLLPWLTIGVLALSRIAYPLEAFLLGYAGLIFLFVLFSKEAVESKGLWFLFLFFFPLYFGILGSFMIKLRALGVEGVVFWLLLIWIADSAAYYGGKLWGRHKVAPAISPNKTIEGTIALHLFAMGVFSLYAHFRLPHLSLPIVLGWGFLLGLLAFLGDLFQSLWKRICQVKDSGFLFPGHGGCWDRTDSLLWTAPLIYYLLQ